MSTLYPIYRNSTILPDAFDMLSTFDKLFDDSWNPVRKKTQVTNGPRANVIRTDRGYTIEMAAPGYSRDEFEMSAEDNTLSIALNTEDSNNEKQKDYHRREWRYSSFTRSWTLPEGTNVEGINARYEAGILYVDIPVEAEKSYRRVITVD